MDEQKEFNSEPELQAMLEAKRKMVTRVFLTEEEGARLLMEISVIFNAYINRLIEAGVGIGMMNTLVLHGAREDQMQRMNGRTLMVGNALAQLQMMEMLRKQQQVFAGSEEKARRLMTGRMLSNIAHPEMPLRRIRTEVLDDLLCQLTEKELSISAQELQVIRGQAQEGADPRQS